MTARIPAYSNLPASELPTYQLFKRWQKATNTRSMERFGYMSEAQMLTDIRSSRPELLKPTRRAGRGI